MRETNPLKFPWKNKCINKKIEETERKKPVTEKLNTQR